MKQNDLSYTITPNDRKNERRDKLIGLAGVNESNFTSTSFFQIPFQQAIRLIASRSVYLENGFAFVPQQRLDAIILVRVS